MRKTFEKLRNEVKTLKKEKETTESKLKEKEEQEAEARGEYKTIAERRAEELRTAEATIAELTRKIETETANKQKEFQEQEKAINKFINQQIANWPDDAKNMIDKEGQVTAAERMKQLDKAAPFVQNTLKSKNAAPGFYPSPRDVREQGNLDENADAKANIRSAIRKGRLVNI